MKKNLLFLSIGLLAIAQVSAQQTATQTKTTATTSDESDAKEVSDETPFNKWTLELGVGQSKGMRPYTSGYYSSNSRSTLGTIDLNSYNLGVRYMFSPKFGVKLDGSFDKFE